MFIASIYQKIVLISPHVEVILRKFYWKFVDIFVRFRPVSNKAEVGIMSDKVDFDKISQLIAKKIAGEFPIIIIHSSYKALKSTNLSPVEIISNIRKTVGENVTIVMPVIRAFEEKGELKDYLKRDLSSVVCEYDKYATPVSSGVLPKVMMTLPDAYISDCPLNPVVAIGPHAEKMMKNNVHSGKIYPHGKESAWYYCLINKALVVGIGVRLHHNLTIRRVFEELGDWPVENWFRVRQFCIKSRNNVENVVSVLERRPQYTVFLAEENMRKKLLENNILEVYDIDGVDVSFVDSETLFKYMKLQKNKNWPYYI